MEKKEENKTWKDQYLGDWNVGVDYSVEQDRTAMQWYCYLCQKPATGVGVVPTSIDYKNERPIPIETADGGIVRIAGRIRIQGQVEFIPYCDEHDIGSSTAYALKAPLTEVIKKSLDEKFPVDDVNQSRSVEVE
jgi:hypothetical protein